MYLRQYIFNNLKEINISIEDLTAETNFILRHKFGIINPYLSVDAENIDYSELANIFKERKLGKPIQYILNTAEFMNNNFYVNENVLIPRPETEILVRKVVDILKQFNKPKLLDIGTGSGCIPIMLKKIICESDIYACDISGEALNVAKQNSLNLNTHINFIKSNLFENINDKFDIIVSNPPYIPPQNKHSIQKEVTFEPDIALYTTDNYGIEFYDKIISNAYKYLKPNGYICFELGINQSQLVKKIFLDYNYIDIEILKDLDNIDRVICARTTNG